MIAEVKPLAADARFNPAVAVKALSDELATETLVLDRFVTVLRDTEGKVQVRASGPGMGDIATAIGMLHIGINLLLACTPDPDDDAAG